MRLDARLFKGKQAINMSRRKVAQLAKKPSVKDAMLQVMNERKRRRRQPEAWTPEVLAKVCTAYVACVDLPVFSVDHVLTVVVPCIVYRADGPMGGLIPTLACAFNAVQ